MELYEPDCFPAIFICVPFCNCKSYQWSFDPYLPYIPDDLDDVWIFPIAMPILTGPGAITTIIVLVGNTGLEHKLLVGLAILLTFLVSIIIFLFSRRINKFVGYTGMLVFTRVMGLFLAALAVDFIAKGIWNIYQTFS